MPDAGEKIRSTDALDDTGWLNGSITATNWTGGGTVYIKYRQWGNIVELRVRVKRDGSNKTIPASGDTSNEAVGSIPSTYAPSNESVGLRSGVAGRIARGYLQTSGTISIASVDPGGGNFAVGEFLTLHATFLIS